MSVAERLDAYQRRHRWVGLPIAVVYKYVEDQGAYLAALITYYAFLSFFPLLLVLVSVLGFVLRDDPALQQRALNSALAQFPVIGPELKTDVNGFRGSGKGLTLALVVSAYGGLGVAQAAQNAMNRVWGVPRHKRPNPFTGRLRSLGLMVVFGFGVLATTVLSGVAAAAEGYGADLAWVARVLALLLAVVANVGLFVLAFRVLTARAMSLRDVWLGAVCAAVAWQVLQTTGAWLIDRELKGKTEVYGVFGLVLGLIFWLYLEAVVVVICAEINAVTRRRAWPRALLTPFTDAVSLTSADKEVYTSYAESESFKGFEDVDVSFDGSDGGA